MAKIKHKIKSKPITDKLGERIRIAREERSYTRAQISERSGISERYLIAIENEGNIPKVPVLNDLLHSLGRSADALFYPDKTEDDSELDTLVRLFQICDARERKIVLSLLNSLIDSREAIIEE